MRDSGINHESCEEYGDVYTVTEITEAIRQQLESEFPRIDVIGEIANFKAHTSGHLYFSLRDEKSLLRVVVFRRHAAALSFEPEDGMLVVASGRISHYGGGGQTELLAFRLVPAGRGRMELEYMRLLKKLMDEGLTAPERKRAVPRYPEKIVVVTSPTGAVIRDILDTLRRRWPVAKVVHICVEVQGPAAAESIVNALEKAGSMKDVDVVLLARGGGSVEDLWTFNTEKVARAVAGSVHPVITGIGHEIDTTVVDYVSDVRAATPTAAAELATPAIEEVRDLVAECSRKLGKLVQDSSSRSLNLLEYLLRSSAFPALIHRLERSELEADDKLGRLKSWWREKERANRIFLDSAAAIVGRAVESGIRLGESALERRLGRLSMESPGTGVVVSKEAVKRCLHMIQASAAGTIAVRKRELDGRLRAIEDLHPRKVLKRGYSYCTTPGGERVIGRVRDVAGGDDMVVNFHDGGALCGVKRKRKGRLWPRR